MQPAFILKIIFFLISGMHTNVYADYNMEKINCSVYTIIIKKIKNS